MVRLLRASASVALVCTAMAAAVHASTGGPTASSDARASSGYLAFVTVKYVNVQGSYEERGTIWTAGLDGSNRRRLVAGSLPDISPDGCWVAYLDDSRLVRVVASHGGPTRIIARSSGYFAASFQWAPDSQRLGVVSGGALFVVDIATGRRVTIDRAKMVWGFTFSPSGDQIAWGRKTGKIGITQGGVDIYRASTRGGARHRLTHDRGSELPVWGIRGIAFSRFEPFKLLHPPLDLWAMRPDGSRARRLPGWNLAPFAWSRDGSRLLATVDSEVDAVPVAVEPGAGKTRRLSLSSGESFTAAFSRDGRRVLTVINSTLVEISWSGGRRRVLARGVDETADWTRG